MVHITFSIIYFKGVIQWGIAPVEKKLLLKAAYDLRSAASPSILGCF